MYLYATTGDGMLTALRVFEACARPAPGYDELTRELEVYPQRRRGFLQRFRARAGALLRHRAVSARHGGRPRPGARRSLRQSYRRRDQSRIRRGRSLTLALVGSLHGRLRFFAEHYRVLLFGFRQRLGLIRRCVLLLLLEIELAD
jgi:hypothetical protein